jgi:hypothetical protein
MDRPGSLLPLFLLLSVTPDFDSSAAQLRQPRQQSGLGLVMLCFVNTFFEPDWQEPDCQLLGLSTTSFKPCYSAAPTP